MQCNLCACSKCFTNKATLQGRCCYCPGFINEETERQITCLRLSSQQMSEPRLKVTAVGFQDPCTYCQAPTDILPHQPCLPINTGCHHCQPLPLPSPKPSVILISELMCVILQKRSGNGEKMTCLGDLRRRIIGNNTGVGDILVKNQATIIG